MLRRPRAVDGLPEGLADSLGVTSHEAAGPELDRDRALGVLPERETRDSQDGGLLLEAAGIGEHHAGPRDEGDRVEIGQGSNADQPWLPRGQALTQSSPPRSLEGP